MHINRRILFVCTGNICRSPIAEYLFRALTKEDDEWECGSAGTAAWEGQPASEHAVIALAEWDIDLTPHRSRRLRTVLADNADRIIVMTHAHRRGILEHWPHLDDRVKTLGEFGPRMQAHDVEDPIGASMEIYRRVRDDIYNCLLNLIISLKGK